jgi:hypothetical protein
MKKSKRTKGLQPDDTRPSKPTAPPAGHRAAARDTAPPGPSSRGPAKSDAAPGASGRSRAKTKPPFDAGAVKRPRAARADLDLDDQQPRRSRPRAAEPAPERYIRMRIRVRDGQLSVLDSYLVDGPLGQVTGFAGSHAYDVTLGDRLLHAGGLPDLGVQRSFVNPEGSAEQRGHHFADRAEYQFMARLPADEVTPETIGQITVRLHRLKEAASTPRMGSEPLGRQFEREVRPVAELVGLPASVLPDAIEARQHRTPGIER